MDKNVKKSVLRMIPYGLYVLTAQSGEKISAATVTWVTQASFEPPLLQVGVRVDSFIHQVVQEAGAFSVLLECIPAPAAARITRSLRVPTIGIGAGAGWTSSSPRPGGGRSTGQATPPPGRG